MSPLHTVILDDEYLALISRAPQQDFVVRTLAKRVAGNTPLMTGELVIASWNTRQEYPLAAAYPLHFRKTYYPGMLRGDPKVEFERHTRAAEVLGIPGPIGYARGVFRSCLLPGTPLDRLNPFGSEPAESNLKHAEALSMAAAAGLWFLAERVFGTLRKLQQEGLAHGDAHLHNFVVCNAPVDVLPIDFDMAVERDSVSDAEWQKACAADLVPLLELAVFLQCSLGPQQGELAALAVEKLDTLFERPEPFRRMIHERCALLTRF